MSKHRKSLAITKGKDTSRRAKPLVEELVIWIDENNISIDALKFGTFEQKSIITTYNIIYKKVYNTDTHNENKVTISIVRQTVAGGDFTYPTTSSEATGLYQYIDNHIKNFDLSWQILD